MYYYYSFTSNSGNSVWVTLGHHGDESKVQMMSQLNTGACAVTQCKDLAFSTCSLKAFVHATVRNPGYMHVRVKTISPLYRFPYENPVKWPLYKPLYFVLKRLVKRSNKKSNKNSLSPSFHYCACTTTWPWVVLVTSKHYEVCFLKYHRFTAFLIKVL